MMGKPKANPVKANPVREGIKGKGVYDLMFQIGDKAVYPGHGVGVIEAIEAKQISGKDHIFFIMRIVDNGMTIMIPHDNVAAVGLREVIRKLDVSKVMHILK